VIEERNVIVDGMRVTRPERLKPHETAASFCWWEGDFTTGIRRYQRRLSKALEF
jgi:hypothetical protein